MNKSKLSVSRLSKYLTEEQRVILYNDIGLTLLEIKTHMLSVSVYDYPKFIHEHKSYSIYGTFIDFLIRKMISDKAGIKFNDKRLDLHNNAEKNTSYSKVKNLCYKDCIEDIFITSLESGVFVTSEEIAIHAKSRFERIDDSLLNNIDLYINKKIIAKKGISLNPWFETSNIFYGEADLILDDEVIDFKVSKYDKNNYDDFLQLLVYACSYYNETGIKINTLTIYNPLLSKETFINISEWNHYGILYNIFYSFKLKIPMLFINNRKELNKIIENYMEDSGITYQINNNREIKIYGRNKGFNAIIVLDDEDDFQNEEHKRKAIELLNQQRKLKASLLRINELQYNNTIFLLERFFSRIETRGHYILFSDSNFYKFLKGKKVSSS